MATSENDVTEGDRENVMTRNARNRAIPDAPLTAEALADAIAKAQQRVIDNAGKVQEKPLPEIVRASVRCGYETRLHTTSDGSRTNITSPKSVVFKASETADGKETTVPHGKPVRLKREAFQRYQSDGLVILG